MKNRLLEFLRSYPVIFLSRIIFGGIFIYASLDKITHPFEFARAIHNYQILPDIFVFITAAILPWIELITGIFLVAGIFPRTSSILLSALLGIFTIALGINTLRGLDVSCGCFSVSSEISDPVVIILRDLLMIIPGLIIIFFYEPAKLNKAK